MGRRNIKTSFGKGTIIWNFEDRFHGKTWIRNAWPEVLQRGLTKLPSKYKQIIDILTPVPLSTRGKGVPGAFSEGRGLGNQ